MFICKNCKSIDKFELMFSPDYKGDRRFSREGKGWNSDLGETDLKLFFLIFNMSLNISLN